MIAIPIVIGLVCLFIIATIIAMNSTISPEQTAWEVMLSNRRKLEGFKNATYKSRN